LGNPEVDGFIWAAYIMCAMAIGLHAFRGKYSGRGKGAHTIAMLNLAVLLVAVVLVIFGLVRRRETLPFREFLATDFLFSVLLYVTLCEVLLDGGSRLLTKWRGEKWTKELDYFYLSLGGIGVVQAISRSSIDPDRMTLPETLGPIAVSIALVLRAIKTRAEIGGWNKV
jgi:hypothetical protein